MIAIANVALAALVEALVNHNWLWQKLKHLQKSRHRNKQASVINNYNLSIKI